MQSAARTTPQTSLFYTSCWHGHIKRWFALKILYRLEISPVSEHHCATAMLHGYVFTTPKVQVNNEA